MAGVGKSNMGHAQAAAGVAGVIKMVMALGHGVLPRTLHVGEPSGDVDWSGGRVSLLVEEVAWERDGEPRRAGVSSFGMSGTNAHVILEEAPAPARWWCLGRWVWGLVGLVSLVWGLGLVWCGWCGAVGVVGSGCGGFAGSGWAVGGVCGRESGVGVMDVGFSLAGRVVLEDRAVVLGCGREELLGGLRVLEEGGSAAGVLRGVAGGGVAGGVGGVVFLFSGQGSQWVGMGRGLYEGFGVFREAFDGVCGVLDGLLGCSLAGVVFGDGDGDGGVAGGLDGTVFAQPGLFALEVALCRLVESWGVRPDVLLGHSVGEVVAAYVAGVFSLEDACVLVAARGRLMGGVGGSGAMVAVGVSEEEVLGSLVGLEGLVSVAGVNGPGSVVLSGDEDAVLGLGELWRGRGARVRRLRVSDGFHSPRMDGVLEEFAEVVGGLSFGAPSIPVVSNVTGGVASVEDLCSVGYWVRHVREPVRFMDGVGCCWGLGGRRFVEVGPGGVLSALAQECVPGVSDAGGGGAAAGEVGCWWVGGCVVGEGGVVWWVRWLVVSLGW